MSTRTRRQERGETTTKATRRAERWQEKLAGAGGTEARFAVKQDWFRSSVRLLVHRHTRLEFGIVKSADPRALAQAERLLEAAGDYLLQLARSLDGGEYDYR